MQDRPNYPYNDYNSLKDPNQQGQNSNKQGKKSNHKNYYKGGSNKNNNLEEMNLNNNDHNNQPYRHNRYQRTNYQQEISNRGNAVGYKKKKGKKRDNNTDFQYQGNNAVEINQPMKEDYNEQNNMGLGGNNHPNMYGKGYKKNQNNIFNNNNMSMNNNLMNNTMNMNTSLGSMNSNTNSTGASNISNLNLTPQSKNQITSPLSFNSTSPLNPKISQQNQQNNIYVNPKLVNEQDINLKDDKSSENLSEDNINMVRDYQQGNKMGGNNLANLSNNLNNNLSLEINKAQSDYITQQEYMNQINPKYLPQQNNFYMPYNNVNGINNINNPLENMGNINNINQINNMNNMTSANFPQMQNIPTYQSPIPLGQNVPNINNMNQMNNLSFNNFQRQIYDNPNNKIYNPNQIQPNFGYASSQDDIGMNHKKIKKGNQTKSPLEQSNLMNASMNIPNVLNNLNYNGPKNTFIKNQSNNIPMKMNNILSKSSKGAKNTTPNFMQNDNINILGNQNQNIPAMLNMGFAPINNRNYYIQQNMPNMRNPHMNQGYMNNNHINIGNNVMNKDFQNPNFNPNMVGNKQKYQKYNPNTYQVQKHNNMNNTPMYQKNKNNILNANDMNMNNNMINTNINNKNILKTGNDLNAVGSNKSNFSTNQPKQNILCLNIKFADNTTKTINIKNLNDFPTIYEELKNQGKDINEKQKKLIQDKINKTYELLLTKKIYEFGITNYTYKNLCEIYHNLNYENQEQKLMKNKFQFIKKNKSFKKLSHILEEEKQLSIDNVRNVGSLNITF